MSVITDYLKELEGALQQGDATEHTHRPALKALLELLDSTINATNEPKRQACGAPDFIIMQGQVPVGFVEAKDIGVGLDAVERGEQLGRYLPALGNLILTDYLEFRWYVNGARVAVARLATVGLHGKLQPVAGGADEVTTLLQNFLRADTPTVADARELAGRMAQLAHLLREAVEKWLGVEHADGKLHGLMAGFKESLLHDLTDAQFADMYAQTISYGLFAARINFNGPGKFTREGASYQLPKTNPFLRSLFGMLAGPDLSDEPYVWIVDNLALLLDRSDIAACMEGFGRGTAQTDPVLHFYETFLAAYDPKMRELRGVYYTPEPVVSYIVRSVDQLLKSDFGLPQGLADSSSTQVDGVDVHRVLILDPATGTGTFLRRVIEQIHSTFTGNKGMWNDYVGRHLLPRIFGFELLMAPYAIAHLKLALELQETGYDINAEEQRLNVFLTNTLEEAKDTAQQASLAYALTQEASKASKVKGQAPVMVVLGNPPYSGHSANTGKWIKDLLHGRDGRGKSTGNYFMVDGQPLGERNPKWLNDDYVKFIRFAQWRIEQTGYGVLAFISNNGYLDNPTFRGMRQSLLQTFDDIYIIDLHGNSKKKEKTPEGGKDENVFDIQQGVAIGIFVKRQGKNTAPAKLHKADLWGTRADKYKSLAELDVTNTEWTEIAPESPRFMFVTQDLALWNEYENFWKVTEIMPVNVLGFQTHRDDWAIDFEKKVILDRFNRLKRLDYLSMNQYLQEYNLKNNGIWNIEKAKQGVADIEISDYVTKVLYRPFDYRYCFYHPSAVDRTRKEIVDNVVDKKNLSINLVRQTKMTSWQHVLASYLPVPAIGVEIKDGSTLFPLYLYPNSTTKKQVVLDNVIAETEAAYTTGRRANLTPTFIKALTAKTGLAYVPDGVGDLATTWGPEDAFHYMYAVFHAPEYRTRYAAFLKMDFPRLPLTGDVALFRELCALGARLVDIHLQRVQLEPHTGFPITGSGMVEKVRYTAPEGGEAGRVWINDTQYITGVPADVWQFRIGGYQVCEKWLKDRKGRVLTYDDISHYMQVVAALAETITLMSKIDEVIAAHGGWPLG